MKEHYSKEAINFLDKTVIPYLTKIRSLRNAI